MKRLIQASCTVLFLTLAFPLHSTIYVTNSAPDKVAVQKAPAKKRALGQKLILNYLQKKMERQRKKGRKNKKRRASVDKAADKLSTFALAAGIATYLLLLIPFLAPLSFFVAIGAVVAGIRALKKGGKKWRAILGIVLGGVFFTAIFIGLMIFLLDPPGG